MALPKAFQRHARVFTIATSLDPDSRSWILARAAHGLLAAQGARSELIDLRKFDLPVCGREGAEVHPDVLGLKAALAPATHIVLGVAIYNYDVGASAKNLVELLGAESLEGRTLAFLCAAGGQRSYMSVMAFAASLMLDFRCRIVPRFVYATGRDFAAGEVASPEIRQRLEGVVDDLAAFLPAAWIG